MEESFEMEDLKKRLILGGLAELSEHGIRDFSLRRVALTADVSCAAPYRHFKDKDALILAIIEYVREGWELLSGEASEAHGIGSAECVTELCSLFVRFWLGNGNFRSVLLILQSESVLFRAELSRFVSPIMENITYFTRFHSISDEDFRVISSTVLSMLYGTLALASADPDNSEFLLSNMRDKIIETFIPFIR